MSVPPAPSGDLRRDLRQLSLVSRAARWPAGLVGPDRVTKQRGAKEKSRSMRRKVTVSLSSAARSTLVKALSSLGGRATEAVGSPT
jgi:hypothetical protein